MVQAVKEKFIVDEKGKPTAVILNIETYRKRLALKGWIGKNQNSCHSLNISESLSKRLREIKEGKASPWKEVWDEL
jgi:hypothetical protein